jgi:hypothetical protein
LITESCKEFSRPYSCDSPYGTDHRKIPSGTHEKAPRKGLFLQKITLFYVRGFHAPYKRPPYGSWRGLGRPGKARRVWGISSRALPVFPFTTYAPPSLAGPVGRGRSKKAPVKK